MKDGAHRYNFSDWGIGDDARETVETVITNIVREHLRYAFDSLYDDGEWIDSVSYPLRVVWFPKEYESEAWPDAFPDGQFFGPSDLLRVFRQSILKDGENPERVVKQWRRAVDLMQRALDADEHQLANPAAKASETPAP